ncbi:MAG: hypothetical protein ACMUIG_00500 [Thermoplasmatota archaeon]
MDDILDLLLDDPMTSMREMARRLNCYRQTIWRKKKYLEDEKIIWGYTAVIDENKLNKRIFLVLMKTKPMTDSMADIVIRRIKNNEPGKRNIRLIDAFQVNGEFDWILRFSAPNHTTARAYYDVLRTVYQDYLIDKPVLVDVNFILVAEGKRNPDIDHLRDLAVSA